MRPAIEEIEGLITSRYPTTTFILVQAPQRLARLLAHQQPS
jgi:hypothetical protein